MADPKAFELYASFGTSRAPYRILGDGSIVLSLELGEQALDLVTALFKAGRGRPLRLMIEVQEPETYGTRAAWGEDV